jgi:hypothetical protein
MEPETQRKPDLASEVAAMRAIAEAIEPLDAGAALRVLEWARSAIGGRTTATPGDTHESSSLPQTTDLSEIQDLAELFHSADPQNEREKALLAAYWLQREVGASDFTGHQANALLRELGHGVANITREFDRLMEDKPQLVIQTRKTGASKQARKNYRITSAGRDKVMKMLTDSEDSNRRERR